MFKKFHVMRDEATESEGGGGGAGDGTHENTPPPEQSSSITISANTDIDWEGNPDYFQTGKKAGTLKPRARDAGKEKPPTSAGGLDIEALRKTNKETPEQAQQKVQTAAELKKAEKAEKKLVEAKIAAKFVMRALDLVTGWISGGTYGKDFTPTESKERNKYREELAADWEDYLQTLDVPMHPALVCILGSVFYVAPAMETPKGKERVESFKEKIVSKVAVGIFKRFSKG